MSRPVSIIVITHSNARTLSRVIEAIDNNSRSQDQKIFVLNCASKEVVDFSRRLSTEWLIVEENEKAGPQHARNKGASLAIHDYHVFLDDDSILPAHWIDHMLTKFTHPRIAIGQGYIKLEKNPRFYWGFRRYKTFGYFYRLAHQDKISLCDTGAVIVSRRWFQAVNGFSPDLNIGEDSYFATKVTLNGGEIFFDMKYPVIQAYDPKESFINDLKRVDKTVSHMIRFLKKVGYPNHIDTSNFFLKRIANVKRPVAYRLIHALFAVYTHLCLTKFRPMLTSGEVKFKVKKTKFL